MMRGQKLNMKLRHMMNILCFMLHVTPFNAGEQPKRQHSAYWYNPRS